MWHRAKPRTLLPLIVFFVGCFCFRFSTENSFLSLRSNFEFRRTVRIHIDTMHRRQDRRRRSRSPSRHARPQDSRSRSRRRSPRQGRRHPPSTSRPPTNQTQFEDIRKIPTHWKTTSDMLDYNTVYGMPLPRRVVSTSASRTLGIDNLPVHEIRLIQVLQDSSYDWCLRQIAAGKNCYLEMFRSRQEAFFSTALHRHLRDSRIDFGQVLQAVAASNNMPCDSTVWENRKMASAKLTQVVGDYMISMVGSNVTEHLTERLRVLETENAQLRASQVNPSQQDGADFQPEVEISTEAPMADESGTHTPCRTTSSQMNLRSPLQSGLHKPPAPTKLPTFTPTPPTKPLPNTQRQLQFGTTPQTPTKHVENMRVGSSFKVLEREGPNNHQIQSINAWMKTKIHDVAIHGKLDELAKKLDEQLNQLPIGQQPSINRYLVEWGMEPSRASKYKPREAIKLLCILHEIRQ